MTRVRVMTYNIELGGRHRQELGEVVRAAAPDVLLVNESPHRPLVWRRQCQALAQRFRLRLVAGGRPGGSNMILLREGIGVKSAYAEVLARPPFRPRRGIVAAQLRVEGSLLGVVGCHLSLTRRERVSEVERVIEVAGRLRGPVVVTGDLNERPQGPSWARLIDAGFVDPGLAGPNSCRWRTFPSDEPIKRIDAILVRGRVSVHAHGDPGVPDDLLVAASDHRPVLAELEF
jgi:endonuclease/exonuclease/phosphatase family metal-dependent hydrolase